jgi:hypothetical protein
MNYVLILYPKKGSIATNRMMLERIGFSSAAAAYLTCNCEIDSFDEIAYLDGIDDVDTTIKVL